MTELHKSVLEAIEDIVREGFDNRASVLSWVESNFARELDASADARKPSGLDPGIRSSLIEAVETAFVAKTTAMAEWPQQTDNDRLTKAFERLGAHGIVARENCGLTQDDAIPLVAEISVVRDELGFQTPGYCLYTWNDMARAMDGDGLSLAYGTFDADPKVALVVAHSVVRECRAAGLTPEWDGSAESFIEFPNFRWQRRSLEANVDDINEFLAGWEIELRAGYTHPSDALAELDERAFEWFADYANFGPALLQRLRVHTEQFLSSERTSESAWTEPTTNDRIAAAFADLETMGIHASECSGLTIQDGWAYAGINAPSQARGVAFFHHEDVIDAVDGRGLYIAFGTLGPASSYSVDADVLLGHEIVRVLRAHDIAATWNKSAHERIHLEPFEWRRRRWTQTPRYDVAPLDETLPTSPSFVSRLFSRDSGKGDVMGHRIAAPERGIVVPTRRSECGFDVRRSRQVRSAWAHEQALGSIQVAHAGIPTAFVRTFQHVALMPCLARANMGVQRFTLFQRGAASRTLPTD